MGKAAASALAPGEQLLSREKFVEVVFAASKGKCIFCSRPAVNAHHILERKLFQDGGYYRNNGSAVCEEHHWDCETTVVSVEDVRSAAGVTSVVLPEGFLLTARYDKWGNRLWASGVRSWGPLEHDVGARRALAKGGFMALMMPSSYFE